MTSEINDVVSFLYKDTREKIHSNFQQINKNREHCLHNPIFSNKENLKPVIATKPMERCQIDLVVFEKSPSEDGHGNVYKYVLSCLNVFSQYVFLRRMKSKSTIEVTNLLKKIFLTFGCPDILQCERGSEFQGIRFYFFSILLSLYGNSRVPLNEFNWLNLIQDQLRRDTFWEKDCSNIQKSEPNFF